MLPSMRNFTPDNNLEGIWIFGLDMGNKLSVFLLPYFSLRSKQNQSFVQTCGIPSNLLKGKTKQIT